MVSYLWVLVFLTDGFIRHIKIWYQYNQRLMMGKTFGRKIFLVLMMALIALVI